MLDALDGRVARLLRGTSKFGAELDSLSDFIGFGVAPALLLYLWTMKDAGPIGWVMVLLFSICCALRLARFNTNIDGPELPPWAKNFFTGVPAPAGGGLVLLPLILSFQVDSALVRDPVVVGLTIVAVAFLLVSRLPTFSFKNFRITTPCPTNNAPCRFVGCLLCQRTMAHVDYYFRLYIASLPFAPRAFKKLEGEAAKLSPVDHNGEEKGNAGGD